MKKKDVIVLVYKMIELTPKDNSKEEPDWASMKIDPQSVTKKYNSKISWVKKTFIKEDFISIEEMEEGLSLVNHEEGVFVVNKKFKKLFKLIYK